jgi:xylem cysteine proteinase
MSEHGKSYGTKEEFELRQQIFADNLRVIDEHNSKIGEHIMGINHMADWTNMEYKKLLGFKPSLRNGKAPVAKQVDLTTVTDVPASLDWREKGAVTHVKNQGLCGSCWAFSSTGSLEGRYQIKTGNLTSMSEQQLVDCSTEEGNAGCGGGLMDGAFEYVEKIAIETEESYPYKGYWSRKCHAEEGTAVSKVTSFHDVKVNDP